MSPQTKHPALPSERKTELRIQAVERSFSGPLPPPEILEKYNQILPGAAERIFAMAESQHTHRQRLEQQVVSSNVFAQKLGVILGFIISMTAIVGGIYLVANGQASTGLAAIVSALAALVGVFVYGRRGQRKSLDEKAEPVKRAR